MVVLLYYKTWYHRNVRWAVVRIQPPTDLGEPLDARAWLEHALDSRVLEIGHSSRPAAARAVGGNTAGYSKHVVALLEHFLHSPCCKALAIGATGFDPTDSRSVKKKASNFNLFKATREIGKMQTIFWGYSHNSRFCLPPTSPTEALITSFGNTVPLTLHIGQGRTNGM
jgi:hypothetical protein